MTTRSRSFSAGSPRAIRTAAGCTPPAVTSNASPACSTFRVAGAGIIPGDLSPRGTPSLLPVYTDREAAGFHPPWTIFIAMSGELAERYGEKLLDFNPTELQRLRLLEAAADPFTQRCLQRLDIQPGWPCLEVGAGAGSIATWLAE